MINLKFVIEINRKETVGNIKTQVCKCAFYILLTAIFLSFLPRDVSFYIQKEKKREIIKGLLRNSSILKKMTIRTIVLLNCEW